VPLQTAMTARKWGRPQGDGLLTLADDAPTMDRSEAITKLRQHEAELKQLGVQHLYLFGSTARGDAREDSDVDLFFDYEKGKLGVYELMDVKEAAARIVGGKADIMTRDSIHKLLRERIEAAAVPVF
jgi:predicted nucleotidyltransferase